MYPPAPYEPPALNDPSMRLKLPADPMAILAECNRHRHPGCEDGPESGLWSVDQLNAEFPCLYMFPVPTFAPRVWPSPKPVSQEEYSLRFALEYPEVARILPIENVVVAGGAAAWPLGEPGVKTGDVDLFVYGIDPADTKKLWRKVDEVVSKLFRATFSPDPAHRRFLLVREVLAPGILTVAAFLADHERPSSFVNPTPALKVQVVLRAYPSVTSILHAFDVPSCAVAFDGRRAYMTGLAAYAHLFRVNLVVPAYRSTTYEARLAKYFGRGFALALPGLAPGAMEKGKTLTLPHLSLVVATARGNFGAGDIGLPGRHSRGRQRL